ncbi:MAG: muconolactone Delta-isomerase family protein [Dehalogenimonas sp.]|jgi:muconolactone delta-isomerase|uniref:Muconolactone Delta-isomerase family protein n=1 Tax=Candidatus Dehalogenimonas loeffleri TaxID=3127115 RepID=A0ABZ2J5S2_9CHLR|nr:muconolactone Delta-isomerase family protein [Dehalogenimonas sp.]
MKYLVSGEQVTSASSHEDQVKFLDAAKDWVAKSKAEGKIEGAYSFVDGGGMFIVNAKDHEEVTELLLTFPLGPFSNLDIRPLLDFTRNADLTINAIKKIL